MVCHIFNDTALILYEIISLRDKFIKFNLVISYLVLFIIIKYLMNIFYNLWDNLLIIFKILHLSI